MRKLIFAFLFVSAIAKAQTYVPLAGTGSYQISGDIESLETKKGIWIKGANYPDNYFGFGFSEGNVSMYSQDTVSHVRNAFSVGSGEAVLSCAYIGSRGLASDYDYTANITDFDFVQKKYVDRQKTSFMTQNGDRTLTSNTLAQNIFDTPSNGTWSPTITGYYEFTIDLYVDDLATASANSLSFGFAGTATVTDVTYKPLIEKAASTSGGVLATYMIRNTTSSTQGSVSNTNAMAYGRIVGYMRVTSLGTVIPQIKMSVASSAKVKSGTVMTVKRLGDATEYSTPDMN